MSEEDKQKLQKHSERYFDTRKITLSRIIFYCIRYKTRRKTIFLVIFVLVIKT